MKEHLHIISLSVSPLFVLWLWDGFVVWHHPLVERSNQSKNRMHMWRHASHWLRDDRGQKWSCNSLFKPFWIRNHTSVTRSSYLPVGGHTYSKTHFKHVRVLVKITANQICCRMLDKCKHNLSTAAVAQWYGSWLGSKQLQVQFPVMSICYCVLH